MRLLFNKNPEDPRAFSREFKETLGYVDADFRFEKIAPDLRTATRAFISEVGEEIYDQLLTTYLYEEPDPDPDPNSTPPNQPFSEPEPEEPEEPTEPEPEPLPPFDPTTQEALEQLKLAQNAIANDAYRLFAPSNDLQHGINGRKMLTSEDSKTPFEYMIVASNDEMERRTHRAMDDLLEYLDANNPHWRQTAAYRETHLHFVRTVKEFNIAFVIDSRYLLQKLQPGLEDAEYVELLPRIGSEAFNSLKEKRKLNKALDEDESVLLRLIQKATAYYALAWGIPRLQATIFPDGIYYKIRSDRATISGRTVPLGNQVDQMAQLFKKDADSLFREIESKVRKAEPEPEKLHHIPERDKFGFDTCDNFVS